MLLEYLVGLVLHHLIQLLALSAKLLYSLFILLICLLGLLQLFLQQVKLLLLLLAEPLQLLLIVLGLFATLQQVIIRLNESIVTLDFLLIFAIDELCDLHNRLDLLILFPEPFLQ